MDIREQFEAVAKELADLRRNIDTVYRDIHDPEVREAFDELLPQFDEAVAGMKQTFPQAMVEIDKDLANAEQTCQETEAALAELKRKLEAPAVAAAAPVAAVGLTAGYSALLRSEILERFGEKTAAPPGKAAAPSDSVASAWPEPTDSTAVDGPLAEVENPKQPSKQQPKQPPKQDHKPQRRDDSKEAWEGLSTMED